MKKTITLFILLFTWFKLLAFTPGADTDKVALADTGKDSIKTQKSNPNLKFLTLQDFTVAAQPENNFSLAAVQHYDEALNTSVAVVHQPDFNLSAITYPDSLNITPLISKPESLGMADSHLAENPSNRQRIKDADSLRLLAIMIRQDSIKSAIYRTNKDSVKKRLASLNVDSLRQQLKLPAAELYKGLIYNEMANRYLNYDTIGNKMTRIGYQSRVLTYTMQALHQYSHYNDTAGLRVSFDHLAKVYLAQKKFSEAKWFILQSNSLSRAKNDPVNVVASLITLSAIKNELSDYKLAMGDLDEALRISRANHLQKTESEVLKNYALLYSRLKNYPKEELMLKKRDSVEEAIRKAEQARLMASLAAKDSAEKKKTDSVQSKKKAISSNTKKPSKRNSGKKIISL